MQPWLVVLLIFGALIAASLVFVFVKNRDSRQANEPGDTTSWLTWAAGLFGLAVTLMDWVFFQFQGFQRGWVAAGCGLILLGLFFRILSRLALGRFYTPRLCILDGHRLITTGIYGIIRHPGYLGFLLLASGVSVLFGSLAGLAVMTLAFGSVILLRIRREEALLLAHFGPAYADYAARTKKLIPFIF